MCVRDRNKWLFGTNVGFVDNAKYLFIYTNEQKDKIRPIWITSSKDDVERIHKMGFEAYPKYSIKGLYHSLTAHVYVFTYHSKDINFLLLVMCARLTCGMVLELKGEMEVKKITILLRRRIVVI